MTEQDIVSVAEKAFFLIAVDRGAIGRRPVDAVAVSRLALHVDRLVVVGFGAAAGRDAEFWEQAVGQHGAQAFVVVTASAGIVGGLLAAVDGPAQILEAGVAAQLTLPLR